MKEVEFCEYSVFHVVVLQRIVTISVETKPVIIKIFVSDLNCSWISFTTPNGVSFCWTWIYIFRSSLNVFCEMDLKLSNAQYTIQTAVGVGPH